MCSFKYVDPFYSSEVFHVFDAFVTCRRFDGEIYYFIYFEAFYGLKATFDGFVTRDANEAFDMLQRIEELYPSLDSDKKDSYPMFSKDALKRESMK